jgi:hypothetical protein
MGSAQIKFWKLEIMDFEITDALDLDYKVKEAVQRTVRQIFALLYRKKVSGEIGFNAMLVVLVETICDTMEIDHHVAARKLSQMFAKMAAREAARELN